MWLPFWLVSTNPAASSRRFTSRNGRGLSRPNLYLDRANFRRTSGDRGLKMEFERFFQIGERVLLRLALGRDVDLKTLGDIPLTFSPNRG